MLTTLRSIRLKLITKTFFIQSSTFSCSVSAKKFSREEKTVSKEDDEDEEVGNFKVNRRENKLFITPTLITTQQQPDINEANQEDIQQEIKKITEMDDFRTATDAFEDDKNGSDQGEYGFRYKGPEPTQFGDWNIGGRCSDF